MKPLVAAALGKMLGKIWRTIKVHTLFRGMIVSPTYSVRGSDLNS